MVAATATAITMGRSNTPRCAMKAPARRKASPFDDDAGEEDQVAVAGQEGFHSVVLTPIVPYACKSIGYDGRPHAQ